MQKELYAEDIFSTELLQSIDINQAFQEATQGVITDDMIELDEKVLRMEHIIEEANSDTYHEFVDLRSMAAQIEMFCNHDHSAQDALQGSDAVNSFLDRHTHKDTDSSGKSSEDQKKEKDKKKKKKHTGWLEFLLKENT